MRLERKWTEDFLNACAKRVEMLIENRYDADPFNYIDLDGDVSLREDTVFERAIEKVAEEEGIEDVITFHSDMWTRINENVFDNAKSNIEEMLKDHRSYIKNPLLYCGHTQSDFI